MRPRLAPAAALLLLACGYRFVERGGDVDPGADRIQIVPLENRSAVPTLEQMLSDALVEEFARRGHPRPVYADATEGGGLRLGGVIREATIRPSALSPVGLALEFEITLVVELDLVRGAEAKTVWKDYRISLTERFLASADPGVHDSNRTEALRRMSAELAGRAADALVQTF